MNFNGESLIVLVNSINIESVALIVVSLLFANALNQIVLNPILGLVNYLIRLPFNVAGDLFGSLKLTSGRAVKSNGNKTREIN